MTDSSRFTIPIRQKSPQDRLIHHGYLLEKLGLLNLSFPIILVGGTNGKGSTTHMISRIFMEAGYRVGMNTSPHLVRFNERAKINEVDISDDELEAYLNRINQDFSDFPLGFNEYSFLVGLYACIDQRVDLGVFEIGLGGRLDPANLLPAKLSVITNIDYDHTDILGDTLAKIAREKAGIIKAGRPVVCGSLEDREAIEVINARAREQKAPIYWEGQDFSFDTFQQKHDLPLPHILKRNAALAIEAALLSEEFLPMGVKNLPSTLQRAIAHTNVPGRLQTLPWKHPLLLDVCHNPGGVAVLKKYLLDHPISGKNFGIFAVSDTKDCKKMLEWMSDVIDYWIFPHIADLKDPSLLRKTALECIPSEKINLKMTCLVEARQFVSDELDKTPGRLVVFGSFYLAGEWLRQNK